MGLVYIICETTITVLLIRGMYLLSVLADIVYTS